SQGEKLLRRAASAATFKRVYPFRREGRGTTENHPSAAPNGGSRKSGAEGARSDAHSRPDLAHPGKWQDIYDDQSGGTAFQSAGSGETSRPDDDRPQRA